MVVEMENNKISEEIESTVESGGARWDI